MAGNTEKKKWLTLLKIQFMNLNDIQNSAFSHLQKILQDEAQLPNDVETLKRQVAKINKVFIALLDILPEEHIKRISQKLNAKSQL